ncbi:unnamed protein product [Somion occarium]|uniref:Lethal giant larvae (Lgl)-like C-terminal domain-containing protein n=1 Tax=Somion occarium TaxID=3059160 RepID=A0ABP1CFQ9_9APHY
MFARHDNKTFNDLSAELNDEQDWQAGILRRLNHYLDVSTFAYEPVSGLLAIGTASGLIHIYGSPGVEARLEISNHSRIKLLQFSSSTLRLLCVDDQQRLHIWDLTASNKPRLQKITNYRQSVNAVALSPSHTHAFVALSNGEVKTYDLLCSWHSPYTIINLWAMYEKISASGMPYSMEPGQVPIEVVIHPRDLNLLFIAYGGGVVLSDLTQRSMQHAYEMLLPPGAPGGLGYTSLDLMTHRRPSVTALAVHPAGHFFAVGHADGSIAFWAVEDEDKPLIVRTLDDIDVNLVDATKLDEILSSKEKLIPEEREPIFKLAWSGFSNSSDPRGGDTTLTVLGGLRGDEAPGITVILFPAFNPSDVTPPDPQAGLPQQIRTAMQESLEPKDAYTYYTKGVPQDFLLLPKNNPHFSGTFDPTAILILYDHVGDIRATEAHQFPPPSCIPMPSPEPQAVATATVKDAEAADDGEDLLSQELASALASMKLDDDPRQLQLPASLWNGPNSILGGTLYALEKSVYEILVDARDFLDQSLHLRGGVAWVEDIQGEMKLLKLQPNRILITYHRNLTIRFQDLTARLLLSSDTSPLTNAFPNPLPALTINLTTILADPAVATRATPKFLEEARIQSVQFASESRECGIILQTGEIALYRLAHGETPTGIATMSEDKELVSLQHLHPQPGDKFHPIFMLMAGRGAVAAVGLSDIGFLAASYADGSLFVVDMRGPTIILRDMSGTRAGKQSLRHRREEDPVVSLTWTVTGTASDPTPRILLLIIRSSGTTNIHTITRSSTGSWSVKENPEKTDAASHPLPGGSFVIDAKGNGMKASRHALATALAPPSDPSQVKRGIWINAGARGVRCTADITGEKLGRAEWGSKIGKVEQVEVVHKNSATVLVAYTDRRQAVVYSLPFLEHLHTVQMEQSSTEPLSADGTGDYIEWVRHNPSGLIRLANYGTLFDIRRSEPYATPDVLFADETRVVPPQPQPVSVGPTSLLSSWIGSITSQAMTGEQIDTLLAGPDRPMPQHFERSKPHAQEFPLSAGTSVGASSIGTINAREIANSASTAANDLYNRLGSALSERGEMLGQLQESFDSLEQGSRKMLVQSKTLAAKQTAKGWFGF